MAWLLGRKNVDEITSLALSQMLGGHRFEGGLDVTGVHIVNIRNHQLPLIFEIFSFTTDKINLR